MLATNVLLFLVGIVALASAVPSKPKQQLLVILIDGFRWDYIQSQSKDELPGFRMLHKEGAQAKWVNPIFPSLSYPSWTTLSTGLYAENHNIIGNYFHDNRASESFDLFNKTATSRDRWWSAEPIWITATRNGKRAALFLWSRCDVRYKGILPEYCVGFDAVKGWQSFSNNAERALHKLEEGFDLVMVYTEHVDNKGHQFGPTSPELKQAVRELDTVLLALQKQLKERQLDDNVNIMIVSDHGMAAGGAGSGVQYIEIDDYVDMDDVKMIIDRAAVASVIPYPGRLEKVYKRLKQMPGVDVYQKEDIPERYRYKNGRNVQDILVVAKPGFFISGNDHPKFFPRDPPGLVWGGFHGYGPEVADMRTVFIGKGPAFKKHFTGEAINLVDIYQIYAHVLGIPPQPHNGTFDHVKSYLTSASAYLSAPWFILSICACLTVVLNLRRY